MKRSRAALRPLLPAHERGALPLVGAAWGVTARNSSHNASNARGVAAGKMGRNSSFYNCNNLLIFGVGTCSQHRDAVILLQYCDEEHWNVIREMIDSLLTFN